MNNKRTAEEPLSKKPEQEQVYDFMKLSNLPNDEHKHEILEHCAKQYNVDLQNPVINNTSDFINLLKFIDIIRVDGLLNMVYDYIFANASILDGHTDCDSIPERFKSEIKLILLSCRYNSPDLFDISCVFAKLRSYSGLLYCHTNDSIDEHCVIDIVVRNADNELFQWLVSNNIVNRKDLELYSSDATFTRGISLKSLQLCVDNGLYIRRPYDCVIFAKNGNVDKLQYYSDILSNRSSSNIIKECIREAMQHKQFHCIEYLMGIDVFRTGVNIYDKFIEWATSFDDDQHYVDEVIRLLDIGIIVASVELLDTAIDNKIMKIAKYLYEVKGLRSHDEPTLANILLHGHLEYLPFVHHD